MEKFETTKSTWIPPRVRELQRQTIVAKHAALLHMCECVDRNDRSLFHYVGFFGKKPGYTLTTLPLRLINGCDSV